MGYQPLHLKYRPQTFADLVGQEAIATTLANAMKTQRIAPAYLLTGARGTGKTSTARILAKSLNCLSFDAPTPTPCGTCALCRAIAAGTAMDVTEIDAASNTGVDNIRDIIERAQFAPVQARYKVYAIDECHMLSNAAFNALLKTLEEPPDRVTFILATTDPQRVLPTIISRCQRFDFRRIPPGAIAQHLAMIAQREAIPITEAALMLIAQIAQGGLRDAEALLDQLSLLGSEIMPADVWDLVGSVPEQELLSLVEAIAREDALTALEQVRHLLDRGREPMVVLHNLAGAYRDLLIAKHAGDRPELVACTADGWARMNILAGQITTPTLISCQQKLAAAETQLRQTTQPRLWLEITVVGLMATEPPPIHSPTPQRQPPAPREPQPAPLAPPAPLKPPTSQDPVAIWQEVERLLSTPSRAIFQQLQPELVEINSTDVLVGLRSKRDETTKNIATQKRADLEKAFERVLHRPLKVRYQFLTPNPGTPPPAPPELPPPPTEPKPAPAIAPATSDDVAIRNVAELFQGQVIVLEEESSAEPGKA